ncbi:hypothetical protein K4K57_006205 [Colletotrichum sp. SAR 10_99]|nr:hypothetical protein K4K55_000063 [Colletotrichum sp. SAR 10_96]KAJ5018140.1 hypothetical protein K4K57_006205 [Colletotrichum sp. SAR 10_99]
MLSSARQSIETLAIPQVDVFYLHAPVLNTPLEETLAGINDAYKAGLFRRLGLSNYPPTEVQRLYDVAKDNGFVLPTVYQGNYSAVARKPEADLFPVLRKLGISFVAYSPIAGGFLTKTREQIESGGTSILRKEYGDGIVFGSSSLSQMEETFLACNRGPLSVKAVEAIERIWEKVKDEAGVDNYQTVFSGD